jgi:hypothetical protein
MTATFSFSLFSTFKYLKRYNMQIYAQFEGTLE